MSGGSDRVYLTLQLLLCSKCPTVNAGHESHLALDTLQVEKGGLVWRRFLMEGVCVCGGAELEGKGGSLSCIQTYSGSLSQQ